MGGTAVSPVGSGGKATVEAETLVRNCTNIFVLASTNFTGLVMCYATKKTLMKTEDDILRAQYYTVGGTPGQSYATVNRSTYSFMFKKLQPLVRNIMPVLMNNVTISCQSLTIFRSAASPLN